MITINVNLIGFLSNKNVGTLIYTKRLFSQIFKMEYRDFHFVFYAQEHFDFSDFNFYNGYVIFTIKRKTNYDVIFEYKFEENKVYNIVLDKNFTETLGYKTYLYDLVLVKDENYYPLCLPSEIVVEEVVADV